MTASLGISSGIADERQTLAGTGCVISHLTSTRCSSPMEQYDRHTRFFSLKMSPFKRGERKVNYKLELVI